MHPEAKNRLAHKLAKDYSQIAGIVVRRAGKTVYTYGPAADQPVHVCSVTKSVVSILVGIALDKGYLKSVDQRVLEFFPGYTVKRGERTIQTITLRHLLTMTAPYQFRSAPYTRFFSSGDWVTASLDLLGGRRPAGTFRYMEMIGPDILSGILAQATGRSMLEFAREALFSPLGITVPSSIVLYTPELHTAFIRESRAGGGWVADESGHNTAGWGLMLTAGDMAKIGQLYLDGGQWEGRRIVSAQWVAESVKEHSRWEKEGLSYGYLWWTGLGHGYGAMGNSGNAIYVDPQQKLAAAVAARFHPAARDGVDLIKKEIMPALEDL